MRSKIKRHKKIAIVVHNTSPGGVQRVSITEASWLNKIGYDTILISILKSKEWDIVKQLNVKRIYLFEKNEVLGRAIYTLLMDKIPLPIKNHSFDAVIAHNIPGMQVALQLEKDLKNPLIILYLHDPLTYPISGSLYAIISNHFSSIMYRLEEKMLEKADIILVNSKRSLLKLLNIYRSKATIRDKVNILYPTINIPLPEHMIKKEKALYLLIVGRIDHEAFFYLYEIMKKINIPLVIAGSYHRYNVNSRKIIKLFYDLKKRGKKITLIFNPSDTELLRLYRNALLFVYPGHENFNMSALEAMSAGCPILVANSSGICEILPKSLREYLCLPKSSIDDWVTRILEIVRNDESYYLGKRLWKITNKYNIYTHMTRLTNIIEGITRGIT